MKKRIWIPVALMVLVVAGVVIKTGFPIAPFGRPSDGPRALRSVGMASFTGRTDLRLSGWVYGGGSGVYMNEATFWTRRSSEDTAKQLTADYSDAKVEHLGDGCWLLAVPGEDGTDFYGLFERGSYSGSKWALRGHRKYLLTDFLVSTYDLTLRETRDQLLPWILIREGTAAFRFDPRASLTGDVKYHLIETAPEDLAVWLCDFYNATGIYRAEEEDGGVRVRLDWNSLTERERLKYYREFFLQTGTDETGRWLMIHCDLEGVLPAPDNLPSEGTE